MVAIEYDLYKNNDINLDKAIKSNISKNEYVSSKYCVMIFKMFGIM